MLGIGGFGGGVGRRGGEKRIGKAERGRNRMAVDEKWGGTHVRAKEGAGDRAQGG